MKRLVMIGAVLALSMLITACIDTISVDDPPSEVPEPVPPVLDPVNPVPDPLPDPSEDPVPVDAVRIPLFEKTYTWSIDGVTYSGNPYDVIATARFVHNDGDEIITPLYYDGDDTFSFRFTGVKHGTWTYTTQSSNPDLDGESGTVIVEDAQNEHARGFLTSVGSRFAVPIGNEQIITPVHYHVYMRHTDASGGAERIHDLSMIRSERLAQITSLLDEAENHGMDALFFIVAGNWWNFESYRSEGSWRMNPGSVDPDPHTFEALEDAITMAHERGLSIHLWMWGDQERWYGPYDQPSGINGAEDRRLQRYIAARLGPLPGWAMSYGYDLNEWVTPAQVRSWHAYIHEYLGWEHLLMAREYSGSGSSTFTLATNKLDVYSNDERPTRTFNAVARDMIEQSTGKPVLFERRFLYTRDGVWDMDTTRRSLWQFSMAPGAAGFYGVIWTNPKDYPNPEQMRTHQDFWNRYDTLDFTPVSRSTGYELRSSDRIIVYAENTDTISVAHTGSVIAVDTKRTYEEITRTASSGRVSLPRTSDWAIVALLD